MEGMKKKKGSSQYWNVFAKLCGLWFVSVTDKSGCEEIDIMFFNFSLKLLFFLFVRTFTWVLYFFYEVIYWVLVSLSLSAEGLYEFSYLYESQISVWSKDLFSCDHLKLKIFSLLWHSINFLIFFFWRVRILKVTTATTNTYYYFLYYC